MNLQSDKDLLYIAQLMNYCCGPFSRSPEDIKSLAHELFDVALKFLEAGKKDEQLVYVLQRLVGGAIVADKRACIDEHKNLIKKWKELL